MARAWRVVPHYGKWEVRDNEGELGGLIAGNLDLDTANRLAATPVMEGLVMEIRLMTQPGQPLNIHTAINLIADIYNKTREVTTK